MSKLGFVLAGFVLEQDYDAPPARLRDFLADLRNLSPLHPLIESIEELPARSDRPHAQFYRVVDRIPMGPFRMRTEYVAALEVISESEVHGDAWQRPGVRLHTVYELHSAGDTRQGMGTGGTHLVERVEITAPWGLARFVVSQARAAHAEMLAGMRELLA